MELVVLHLPLSLFTELSQARDQWKHLAGNILVVDVVALSTSSSVCDLIQYYNYRDCALTFSQFVISTFRSRGASETVANARDDPSNYKPMLAFPPPGIPAIRPARRLTVRERALYEHLVSNCSQNAMRHPEDVDCVNTHQSAQAGEPCGHHGEGSRHLTQSTAHSLEYSILAGPGFKVEDNAKSTGRATSESGEEEEKREKRSS